MIDHSVSIHVPLLKDERGEYDPATWPASVSRIIAVEIDNWCKRHPELDIVDQRFDFDPVMRVCNTSFRAEPAQVAT